ncbi:MAG: amidohydrolase family protein [Candidatus Cloacimonetes bacterium]|nr:amidohydrolase family protein [Candidatus Cloacimonadota bacterium]
MKLYLPTAVFSSDDVRNNVEFTIGTKTDCEINLVNSVAYPPLINCHDHLVGNWYPKAGKGNHYINSHIWVKDMKESESVRERNKFWVNDGKFDLLLEKPLTLVWLSVYKNIFSGVGVVQDHAPIQHPSYYERFPINVLKNYRQCHSITLGNWWGGEDMLKEMELTEGKMPYIIHLGEGLDAETRAEFSILEKSDLLCENTLIIHGISLSDKEIEKCAETGTSINWCPSSNYFLIGKTINIDKCIESGVNIVLGTDSTLTGSVNLFAEMRFIVENFPHISCKQIYKMVSANAEKALYLDKGSSTLHDNEENILILRRKESDEFKNLVMADMDDIELFIFRSIPLFGNYSLLENFDLNPGDYSFFEMKGTKKFIFGHPEIYMEKINKSLGYKKSFPYLPCSF